MTAAEIGKMNALEALDQQHEFSNLKAALGNYVDNVRDTLAEYKLISEKDLWEAEDAFNAVLKAHNINIKVW